jgi:hypothetical protein
LRSIPLKLQAEWAKSATNKVTDIDQVLKFIEEQVEAAERLSSLRATTPKPAQNSQQPAKTTPPTTPTASRFGVSSKPTPQSKHPSKTSAALCVLQGDALGYELPNGAERERSSHHQPKKML